MRTVWLALFCLIGLATTVLVKIISPYASADVPRGVPPAKAEVSREISSTDTVPLSSENVMVETKGQNDRSPKADKIERSYASEAAPEIKPVKSVSIVLPTPELKQLPKENMERIVSRHWHDPFDERSVPAASQPPAKRKVSNTRANRPPGVTARAPKS
jgi:hypothetical protein